MVCCELDDDVSGEALGWSLPAWQALLLHRFLPSCGGLGVYITLVCFDLALVVEHFQNGDTAVGSLCVILFMLPALASLIFTLASPPPGLRPDSADGVNIDKDDLWWVLQQIVNFFAFPVAAICRYCHQIFWSMEAVCGAYVGNTERARGALLRVRAPSSQELYLFLQAFLHAAPHALLNIIDMLAFREQPSFDKISVQSVSIVVSLMRMASTATLYRRFEREKLTGRRYPWAIEKQSLIQNEKRENTTSSSLLSTPNASETTTAPQYASLSPNTSNIVTNDESLIQKPSRYTLMNNLDTTQTKEMDKSYSFIDNLAHRLSFSSSGSEDYLTPVTPPMERLHRENSYVEAVQRKSIIERVAPKRDPSIYNIDPLPSYTIETVEVPPPPSSFAPRPMSVAAAWAEKLVENAESLPEWLSAPQRRRYVPDEPIETAVVRSSGVDTTDGEVPVPVATTRTYMRGLEPQDASASIVHYLSWYLFFIARMLSIATFLQFHPVIVIIVLMCHYQLMLLLLIVPQASTIRRCFYIFLAFVYVFCLLEFKVRFRHVRAWHVFWLVLCTIEIVVFAGIWGTVGGGGSVHWWWQSFMLSVIFISLLLSYMCMLVYFVLLKPRETVVYLNQKK